MSEHDIQKALKEAFARKGSTFPKSEEEVTAFLKDESLNDMPPLPDDLRSHAVVSKISGGNADEILNKEELPSPAFAGLRLMAARNGKGIIPKAIYEKMQRNKTRKKAEARS